MQIPSFKLSLTDSEQPCRQVVSFIISQCQDAFCRRFPDGNSPKVLRSHVLRKLATLELALCKLGIEETKGSIQERHSEGFTDKPSCCLLSMASSLRIDQSVGQSKPGLHALHASQETSPPLTEHLADWKQACLRLADLAAQIH